MSNSRRSFPVSGSQGTGNRETGANALANHDLVSPGPVKPKSGRGKQRAGRAAVWDATGRPTASSVPSLKVDGLYQPQSTDLEALVDVLQLLLVAGSKSPTLAGPSRPAFRGNASEQKCLNSERT
jgi:hypothetical protein